MYGAGDIRAETVTDPVLQQSTDAIVRPGGLISRGGVPQCADAPVGFRSALGRNAALTDGPAPVRAHLDAAIPQVLPGELAPGRVVDREVALADVAEGYRLMDTRDALTVLVRP